MKIPKRKIFLITSFLLCSFTALSLSARSEGRGGGGGRGGRPSPSMHREARDMRNLPENRRDNLTRGGRYDRNFQEIPSNERREISPRRDFNPPQVGEKNNLRELLDQRYGTSNRSLENRRIDTDLNRSLRRDTNARIDRRFYNHQQWFGQDFFGYHNIGVPPYWSSGWNPWRAAPWVALAGWISWGSGIYGGDGAPAVYYDNGSTYTVPQNADVNSDSGASSQNIQDTDTANASWLPLGVFALQNSEESISITPHLFLQLAINKQGVIEGIFYNAATDRAHPVRGVVNQKTQMVAIERSDVEDAGPTVISALYNFTLDSAPVTVEFPNGNKESWKITRVDAPEQN